MVRSSRRVVSGRPPRRRPCGQSTSIRSPAGARLVPWRRIARTRSLRRWRTIIRARVRRLRAVAQAQAAEAVSGCTPPRKGRGCCRRRRRMAELVPAGPTRAVRISRRGSRSAPSRSSAYRNRSPRCSTCRSNPRRCCRSCLRFTTTTISTTITAARKDRIRRRRTEEEDRASSSSSSSIRSRPVSLRRSRFNRRRSRCMRRIRLDRRGLAALSSRSGRRRRLRPPRTARRTLLRMHMLRPRHRSGACLRRSIRTLLPCKVRA